MKKWIFYSLIVLFSAVFIFCGIMLFLYFAESKKQADIYDELSQIYQEDAQTAVSDELRQEQETAMLPEFTRLYEINDDIVGWIKINGTQIDYPVMQSPDDQDYYLSRNFYQENAKHGCIYAYAQCQVATASDNITLFGHNMKDGSMFADLLDYKKSSFWESHRFIEFSSLYEHHTYEIFAVFTTTASQKKGFRYHTFTDAANQEEFDSFVNTCLELSLYDTGIVPQYTDKLITLSTCEYSQTNGRLVVVARRID